MQHGTSDPFTSINDVVDENLDLFAVVEASEERKDDLVVAYMRRAERVEKLRPG